MTMKRLLTTLLALMMVFTLACGALAEGLVIASENGDPVVPEVEVELTGPEGETAVANDGEGLPVDAAHFPDAVFCSYISQTYDMNKDGYLDQEELDYADAVMVDDLGVTSLKGIELLHNLNHLSCTNNKGLTAIDVSQNKDLAFFNCTNCGLTSLSVKGLDNLDVLFCSDNPLKVLDLEGCECLTGLHGEGMPTLEKLILKNCESLLSFDCSGTRITSLDLTGCSNLVSMCVNECSKLASVNLKGATDLVSFAAMSTALTKLDVSNNPELRFLFTIGCDIERIDISKCPELVKAVNTYEPACDGGCTMFGPEDTTYDSDIGPLSGYPIDIMSSTKLIVNGKVVYEPKFSLAQTGTVTLVAGKKTQLELVYWPEALVYYPGKVTWTSSDKGVATVNGSGLVKGVKKGEATVTATSPWGATASVKVKVTAKQPTKVKLDKKGVVNLAKGKTLQLKATLTPKSAESALTWTSSAVKVATVDQSGKVKAVGKGMATITVTTENGKSASVKIKVR